MIVDCYTATALPGQIPELDARLEKVLENRTALSPLAGAWRAEIGELSQVVQLWPYRDLAHRADVLERAPALVGWPVDGDGVLEDEQLETWTAVPFATLLEPGAYGSVYEMRTYSFRPGTMERVLEVWANALPARVGLSPLVACLYAQSGRLNRLRHIWAYADLNERARLRQESLSLPGWPPMTREWRVHEVSQVLVPAAYSPLR